MNPFRENLRLALPLILANLTVPMLGMVDTAVVGRLEGAQFLAAAAMGAALLSMLLWVFGFLRMGTSGLTAQAFGGEDGIEIKVVLVRSLILAGAIGTCLLLLAQWIIELAAWGFGPTGQTQELFAEYTGIRLWGLPAMLANHVFIGWFLGRQNPYWPLVMMGSANGLNALLDVILVFGFGFGLAGVAIATVIADYTAFAIGGFAAWRAWQRLECPMPSVAHLMQLAVLRRFLALSRDLFLRTLMMQVAFLGFVAIGARQGDLVVAVNGVLMNFFALQTQGLDGFADATEAMTGRAVGRHRVDEMRAALLAGFANGLVLTAILATLFALFGADIVALLTTLPEVRAGSAEFLPYIAMLPLVSVTAFIFDGLYFGATRGAELRNSLFFASALFILAAAIFVPAFGNHGLWWAFLLFMLARGMILGWIYRRADWGAGFVRGSRS